MDIIEQMKSLKRGESCVYHTGNLLIDGAPGGGNWRDVHTVRSMAYYLYKQGKVHLLQRRAKLIGLRTFSDEAGVLATNNIYNFDYIAVGR